MIPNPSFTRIGSVAIAMVCSWLGLLAPDVGAAQPSAPPGARCEEIAGTLLVKKQEGWEPVKVGADLPVGGNLLALFQAKLLSANHAIQATMVGDVGMHGKLPVMEAALQLEQAEGFDLALALKRGIVVLENRKAAGEAKVQVKLRGQPVQITLREPGAKLGIEIYSRHAPGRASIKADDPATFVIMLAIKGDVLLTGKHETVKLHAPPGPALLRWDSISMQVDVEHLAELPPALQHSVQMKLTFAKMAQAAKVLESGDQEQRQAALKKLMRDEAKIDRLVAVTAAGALDDLGLLLAGLNDAKHADVREQTILVLRNWAGREPGQLAKMQKFLMKEKQISAARAGTMIHLLLGFEVRDADTFDTLIHYLESPRLGVRTLAYWHLVRLVPDGRDFGYDPAADDDVRRPAWQRWRDLIPPGELPPAPKK